MRQSLKPSVVAPRRTAPVLQRRPDAARQPETIDGGRRSQRFEAVEFDAAPLEAAFFQNVARSRIGDARAGAQVSGIELLKGEIDHGTHGLGGQTLPPMVDPYPVAEFRRLRLAPVDADHADRLVIPFDQENRFAVIRYTTNEFDRVSVRIGMRQATGILRNAAIVGEMCNGVHVRERRLAQRKPFGFGDASSSLAQRPGRDILQHLKGSLSGHSWICARLPDRKPRNKKGGRFPASPWSL